MDKETCQCDKVKWECWMEVYDHERPGKTPKLWFTAECVSCGKVTWIPYRPGVPKSLRERRLFLMVPEDVLQKGLDALAKHGKEVA